MNLDAVQEEANESLLESWPAMLAKSDITQPIFNPIVPRELLSKHSSALNGAKLKKHLPDFKLQHPVMTAQEVGKIVVSWRSCKGVWPNAQAKK